ncbi:RING finger protein 17 [Seriola lalandi dorsalis]|uniref:RING finger protein 17 n=1 Tax=Seriola lalandi dorsalis TaxID=1841481 RepID=UPI000C6F9C77|nr:RING finger protein 17 [Seriola lalandi dorsalis]
MDRRDNNPSAVICKLCGEVFTLPEDEVDGNLPRVLLCGHIYCTSCLRSIQCDTDITCPECEVKSTLPEGGVYCLQEDSRIIGLIYTSKMNKMKSLQYDRARNRKRNKLSPSPEMNANTKDMDQPADIEKIEKTVDEALVQAAENLAQLEHIHETLTTGLAEQVKREKARLETEIKQAADKALHAIQKWRDVQLAQLTKLEAQFSTSQAEACRVQERIKALEIAMQMAREVRRVPFLEQYCTLDKVLETLQAPVDKQSFDMKCITMGSGMSCVFQSESLSRSLALSLKMEVSNPKRLSDSPPKGYQPGNRKSPLQRGEGRKCVSPSRSKTPSPQNPDKQSPGANSHSSRGSSPSPKPRRRSNASRHSSGSDIGTPDVIIEELLEEGQEHGAPPPTGPELANDKWRVHRRRKNQIFGNRRNVTQWVVVTHVVNPSHFYVRYVAERKESESMSKKINHFCCRDSCHFSSSDAVETGSMILVKWKEGLWCRTSVVELLQVGCAEAVKTCKVSQLATVRVFFLDYGFTKSITIQSDEATTESSLDAVNNHLRKVGKALNVDLGHFAPQAIRCSLKDLVPYDLTKGWSKEAQVEFRSVVSSAAVEMRPLGQDTDSLLVDLRKAPMDQSSDIPISVREYLVFIEVARFYSPVTLSRRPLLYYPPVYPKINTELNAVVSHINDPADFFIQLVDNMESLLLSAKLQDCYNATTMVGQDELCIYCPVIGQACVALYDDKQWYRAQVIGHPGGRKVEVRFVDFGNKKILSVSDLKKIKDEFFALPSMTKGWSKEAQVEFRSVVSSAAVEMRPLGQDTDSLLVDLRKAPMDQSSDIPISVREYLVFIEVARFYSPVTLSRRPLLYYPPVYPKINTELNAVVSHINDPADFFIQLVDNMESLLLSAKLQDCYNATTMVGQDELCIYCPVIGQACVALYDDKQWYRAQVIGHPGGRKVEVRFVDFGNKKILSVSDLKKIKDEFFALPSMAIQCGLSNVIPLDGETWSDACTNRFISLAHQKLVTIMATGKVPKTEPLPIKLFESGLNGPISNIAELLVKEELACFKDGPKSKHVRPPGDDSAVWDPPLELGSAAEGVGSPDQNVPREQDEEPLEFQPQLRLPAQLKDLKVRVCHVNSPSSFYVQFTQYNSQLKRICEQVKKECALVESQDVAWKADMYCAAQINGVWERGQICSDVTSSNIAEVIRCDHGNKVKLHVSNLKPLPTSLMGSLALECTLTDIRPAGGRSTWTATACDLFSHYLTGASAVMTIKELTDERPAPVTLFCSNKMGQFVSIADFLASEGLALRERKQRDAVIQKPKETDAQSPGSETQTLSSTDEKQDTPDHLAPSPVPFPSQSPVPSTPTPPKAAPRSIMSAEKVKTQLYNPPELPCLGHIQINVSAIGEDGLLYTRTQYAESQLEQLRERIQQRMNTLPRQKPYTWKSVLGCAVIGPDMLWYRGQLLEVLGGHVKVQYVDYGLVENIPVVHVHPMLLCDDVPQLCMPCQLHGLNPVGGRWQRDAVALLREVLLNRCVDMRVVELPTDPREPLTVELFLDGLSLSRILCHHEHASMDRTVSAQKGHSVTSPASFLDDWDIDTEGLRGPEEPPLGPFIYPNLPQEGEKFQVRVKHLWTPNELFLWPLEGTADVEVDGERLDDALTRINANINSLQRLSSFPHGGPCLAEYSDGKYYRAKLMKFTSVEPVMILVQHVDFGSDDTLPISKLRQMPAELLRFPSRALKVKVAGFKAPSVERQEDVLPYSPGWSVKAAMEMIELLHSNITASVVAREPELTVLLYNEDEELVHLPLVSSGLAELE